MPDGGNLRLREGYPHSGARWDGTGTNFGLNGEYFEELGVKDLTWINADGSEMQNEQWGDSNMRCFGMLLDGRASTSGLRQKGREATTLKLPESPSGNGWSLVIDTNFEDEQK